MAPRLTAADRLLRSIDETAWQAHVEAFARLGRWRWYHAPANRPSVGRGGKAFHRQTVNPGFPDLVLVRGPRLLAVELKRETGTVSPDQLAWLEAMAGAGAEVGVWRPRDRDVVEAVLLRGAPMPPWSPPAAAPVAVPSPSAPANGPAPTPGRLPE